MLFISQENEGGGINMTNEHTVSEKTATVVTNRIIANMGRLHVKLHQYHWYVKGPHFFTLHEKFEELYNENQEFFDRLAERLIIKGEQPVSTTEEFIEYATISESPEDKDLPAEKMVAKIVEDYKAMRDLTVQAIELAADEDDAVLEDMLIEYKEHLDKTLWMLSAFLG